MPNLVILIIGTLTWTAAAAQGGHAPFVLEDGQNPAQRFEYEPVYTRNVPSFDSLNRPYIRGREADLDATAFVHTLREGGWVERSFINAIEDAHPGFVKTRKAAGWHGARIVFNGKDTAFTLLAVELMSGEVRNLLLSSGDYWKTCRVDELPEGTVVCEHPTGHNTIEGVPFLGWMQQVKKHPTARWGAYHALYVTKPRLEGEELILPEPIRVTGKCFGMSLHSGGASFAATHEGRTHFVWAEMTEEDVPGAPTYAAAYDHASHTVSEPVFIAHAPPVNDVHNTPGICLDNEGYLHVITGSHGDAFIHRRSLKPNDVQGGWTEPEHTLDGGWVDENTDADGRPRQTYLSLLCDADGTLHIFFRQWRRGVDKYHADGYYGALSYQRKKKGQPWEDARVLAVPALPNYAIWYHKASLDRQQRLFLSFSYLSGEEVKNPTRPGTYYDRMVIFSDDRGDTWRLAKTADFESGVLPEVPETGQ